MEFTEIKSRDEAREKAIDWQEWQNDQSLSWGELSQWQDYFTGLAKKFYLTAEFKENGIIWHLPKCLTSGKQF